MSAILLTAYLLLTWVHGKGTKDSAKPDHETSAFTANDGGKDVMFPFQISNYCFSRREQNSCREFWVNRTLGNVVSKLPNIVKK